MIIDGFTDHHGTPGTVPLAWSVGGDGPPLLLLHGFPQTRALWADIAPELARRFTVVCPDLRGYGDSGKPVDVSAYSFREMARDQIALMTHLGFERFDVAGHDRGGRVAHRLALDHPDAISRLCVMDIVPTHTLLSELRREVATSYYHWFFLAQPEPMPETLIASDPDLFFHSCLTGWGAAGLQQFASEQLDHYRAAWSDAETIRGMCNDYRATLFHDFLDDSADLETRLNVPVLVLYGKDGAMARLCDIPESWAAKCHQMQAMGLPGGHFFVDTHPQETLRALTDFFRL